MLTKSIKSINLLYGNTPYNRKQTRRNKNASDLGTKKTRLQVLSFESPLLGKTKRRRTDGRTDRQTDGRTDTFLKSGNPPPLDSTRLSSSYEYILYIKYK